MTKLPARAGNLSMINTHRLLETDTYNVNIYPNPPVNQG